MCLIAMVNEPVGSAADAAITAFAFNVTSSSEAPTINMSST